MPGAGESWLSTCSVSRILARRHHPTHPQLPQCGWEMRLQHSTLPVLLGWDDVFSLPVVDPAPRKPGIFSVFYYFFAILTGFAVFSCMAALSIGPLVFFPIMGLRNASFINRLYSQRRRIIVVIGTWQFTFWRPYHAFFRRFLVTAQSLPRGFFFFLPIGHYWWLGSHWIYIICHFAYVYYCCDLFLSIEPL